ncbi:MAG: HAD-IA family hydrolase [Actinomycetota bacterium]|nr:HAD-IA family hydrolase [Actinomycetota bacterium]
MIDIVFFDAGGTILDPHPSFAESFSEVCGERGRTVAAEEVRAVQERVAPHLVELLEEAGLDHGPTLSLEASRAFWTFTYRRFLAELGIEDDRLATALYERFSSPSSYRLYDDVIPAIESLLAHGKRIGLISNFDGWLEAMLVEMEVHHHFDVSVISGIEGIEKPDPAIYDLAVRKAGVDARSAVHVGDSPVMDIEPARKAGMNVVLLDRVGRYPDADVSRITSLEDLPELVRNL